MTSKTIHGIITDSELSELTGLVPYPVQIRHKLNRLGFKFYGDDTFSVIIELNPSPKGILTSWYDNEKLETNFKQVFLPGE